MFATFLNSGDYVEIRNINSFPTARQSANKGLTLFSHEQGMSWMPSYMSREIFLVYNMPYTGFSNYINLKQVKIRHKMIVQAGYK